jgi:soluble lytic murein transglycosylase
MRPLARLLLTAALICCVPAAHATDATGTTDRTDAAIAPTATPAADADAARQDFIAAIQRVRTHQPDQPDSPALVAYPIYDYLLAARMRRDLDHADPDLDTRIDTFIQDRPQLPVVRNLKHDWLLSLAARERWDWLVPRTEDATDPVLVCDHLAGRLASGDSGQLRVDALTVWQQPVRAPHACDGIFAWLRAQNALTPAAAETRARGALAANDARLGREFALDVPPPRQDVLLEWARLLEVPRAALEELAAHPEVPVEPQALGAGFARLAKTDAVAAARLLPALQARQEVSATLRSRMQRLSALGLAYDHSPDAVAAFRALPPESVDDDVQEWRLRAALWSGDFAQALAWTHQLPASLATLPRWRYWQARATEQTLGHDAAVPLYEQVAGMRDYYGYLAADHLQRHYQFNHHPSPDDAQAQHTLAQAPGMVRAHELFACELQDEAQAEWAQVLIDAEPATKVQAAHLATQWGWYNQAIVTLAQSGQWDDLVLRYPRPYAAQVAQASTQAQLSGDWIYAVMRQESLFRRDVTSRADARGLMQLQPATASALARRQHLPVPGGASLYDPGTSILFGATYLKELSDRYHGELAQTFAAYNAGVWAVGRWMPPGLLDADVWVENIPYNETRNYVQHVLEHMQAYSRDHADQAPRLSLYLAPIDPTSVTAPAGDPPQPH